MQARWPPGWENDLLPCQDAFKKAQWHGSLCKTVMSFYCEALRSRSGMLAHPQGGWFLNVVFSTQP